MADAVAELGRWQQDGATLGDVLDALDRLRRDVPFGTATRTSVLTLIAVVRDEEEAEWAAQAVHELGRRHPTRTVTVSQGGSSALQACVRLLGSQEEGRTIWSEDVSLRVRGPVTAHFDSLVEPLVLPDLPVVVWFVDELPDMSDPLIETADAVLVDARDVGTGESLAGIVAVATRRPVVDLSWIRLRPWRELFAGLFDGDFREFALGIDAIEIAGKPGPRRLLGGWLAARLRLHRRSFHFADANHASIRAWATVGGSRGEFAVTRAAEERLVRATAAVAGGPSERALRALPPRGPSWGLAEALTNLDGDPVYDAAVAAAHALSL